MWTIDYQAAKGSPWVNLGSEHQTTPDAWDYFVMIRITTGLDYYAVSVRPVR